MNPDPSLPMSYEFELPEPVPAGVRRIADEQAEKALDSLHDVQAGDDPDEGIHDARKRFKKIRAVLRLVRQDMGQEAYKRENVAWRDAGRLLSDVRESNVAPATVETLAESYEGVLDEDAFAGYRETLRERHQGILERALEPGGPLERAVEAVEEARARIDAWPLDRSGFDAVGPGVRKVYKRGRNRMREAYDDPAGHRFHEWRKRVKYLWYHTRILGPTWEPVLEPWADVLHDLADHLGLGNDYTDLLDLLREEPALLPSWEVREALEGLALERREELWRKSYPLGLRLYHEEPDAMVARLRAYWDARHTDPAAVLPGQGRLAGA